MSNKLIDLAKEISKQNIKRAIWFLLAACEKYKEREINLNKNWLSSQSKFRGNKRIQDLLCSKINFLTVIFTQEKNVQSEKWL